jgi:hypothetical protein
VRTLLYGGNANLYHTAVSKYRELLDLLSDTASPHTRVITAIGPDYGKMLEQARILAQTRYRTAMVLPLGGFTTPAASRRASRALPTPRAFRSRCTSIAKTMWTWMR